MNCSNASVCVKLMNMQIRGVLHTADIIYGHESQHLFILTSIDTMSSPDSPSLSLSLDVSLSFSLYTRAPELLFETGYQSYLLNLVHALSTHSHPGTSRALFKK